MIKYFITAFLLVSHVSFSQFIIRGRVLEGKNKSPVSYANVSITNSTLGSSTDEQGKFFIKVDPQYRTARLNISCLGFGNRSISIDSLARTTNGEITILMNSSQLLLEDVVIKGSKISPLQLLQDAIAAIPQNYSQTPFNLEFYSKMEVKDSIKTHYVSENILLTYRKGYIPGAFNKSKIIQARTTGISPLPAIKDKKTKKEYFPYTHAFEISLSDQLGYGLEHNGYTVFNPKKAKGMKFTYAESSIFDKDTVVAIQYSNGAKYTGVIYIAINNLAIIRHFLKIGNSTRDIIYKKYKSFYYPYSIQSDYPWLYNNKSFSIHQSVSLQNIIIKDLQIVERNTGWNEDVVPYDKMYWDNHFPIK